MVNRFLETINASENYSKDTADQGQAGLLDWDEYNTQ